VQMPRGHSKGPSGPGDEGRDVDWGERKRPQTAVLSGSNQKAPGFAA
jgi:hypothetical protein